MGGMKIYEGDCRAVLELMPSNSVDAIVTDPPYELSNDGKASASRIALEFMFPEDAEIKTVFSGKSQLSAFISKILALGGVGAAPSPSSAVPITSVAFNNQPAQRKINIEDTNKSAVSVSCREGMGNIEAEETEHLGCFHLKFADASTLSNTLNSAGTSFDSGGLRVGLGVTQSSLMAFLESSRAVVLSDHDVRGGHGSLSHFISTFGGATRDPVPCLHLGRRSVETLGAYAACVLLAVLESGGAQLVAAATTASGLSPVFESRRISIVNDAARRALSFDLILRPQMLSSRGFMGKEWDGSKITYDVGVWKECLRVLKPGGHLLSFGGSRTYHRMACAIEDAGFEIRDQIMWVYGSGFPKSLDVAKSIDKAARGVPQGGVDPTSVNHGKYKGGCSEDNPGGRGFGAGPGQFMVEAGEKGSKELVIEAQPWEGWGTALKPAHEDLVLAQKPHDLCGICGILAQKILEGLRQLPSFAKDVKSNSLLSRSVFVEGFDFVQWRAVAKCSTPGDLFVLTDMWPSELAIPSSLSIGLSWLGILDGILRQQNTFTTETRLGLTTDLKTLNSLLSQSIPNAIIEAAIQRDGTESNASLAERIFSAVSLRVEITRELSVRESVISRAGEKGLRPDHEPICMARKTIEGTVAANILKWGTGAINVDGCRVETTENLNGGAYAKDGQERHDGAENWRYKREGGAGDFEQPVGRWPANLIHDGSDEVLDAFPQAPGQQGDLKETGRDRPSSGRFGNMGPPHAHKARRDGEPSADRRYTEEGATNFAALPGQRRFDAGSAARFFYCAKTSKAERGEGNNHPTVKPQALMRYLCRLVTPPGGVVLDPFAGSGSTALAALKDGFDFIGIEKDAGHVSIINSRLLKEFLS
jgi:DNA modification methylase